MVGGGRKEEKKKIPMQQGCVEALDEMVCSWYKTGLFDMVAAEEEEGESCRKERGEHGRRGVYIGREKGRRYYDQCNED